MFHYLVKDGAMRAGLVLLILWECTGCAVAHHVQLGDIDSTTEVKRFEIKVSESTVNVTGALGVASVIAKNPSVQKKLRDAMVLVALFQMGPRTGLGVYNDIYAEQRCYKKSVLNLNDKVG